jgi:hypothetical protein
MNPVYFSLFSFYPLFLLRTFLSFLLLFFYVFQFAAFRANLSGSHTAYNRNEYLKLNSVALVRERNIPEERQSLVDEGSANFCG